MVKFASSALLLLLLPFVAHALPLGNPWEASLMRDGLFLEGHAAHCCPPCRWSVRLGFYGDYVWDRVLELDESDEHATIRRTQLWTNAGYFALNFWDQIDLFATFGATQIEINTPTRLFGLQENIPVTIACETNFSWSLGLRGTIWEWGCFGFGGEVHYFQTRPDIDSIKLNAHEPEYPTSKVLKYQEWQVGFGAAYRVSIACPETAAIPYLGIRWGGVRVDMGRLQADPSLTFDPLRAKKDLGYAFGLTLLGSNKCSLTAEARFSNEKALYVNGQFRY